MLEPERSSRQCPESLIRLQYAARLLRISSAPLVPTNGGPLEGLAGRFDTALVGQGFTAKSRVNRVRLRAHLSRWLEVHVVGPDRLTAQQVEGFLAERRRTHTGLFSRLFTKKVGASFDMPVGVMAE